MPLFLSLPPGGIDISEDDVNNKSLVALGIYLWVSAILAGIIYFRLPWQQHFPFWVLGLIAIIIGWSMGKLSYIVLPFSEYEFGTRLIVLLPMSVTMMFLIITTIMVFLLQAQ